MAIRRKLYLLTKGYCADELSRLDGGGLDWVGVSARFARSPDVHTYIRMTCMINISLYKYSICHFDNQISQPPFAFPLLPTPTPSAAQFNPVVGHSSDKILSVYAESGFCGAAGTVSVVVGGRRFVFNMANKSSYSVYRFSPSEAQAVHFCTSTDIHMLPPIHQLGLAPLFVE